MFVLDSIVSGNARIDSQRVKGIEPSSVAWKATALPLSYTRAPIKLARLAAAAKSFLGAA